MEEELAERGASTEAEKVGSSQEPAEGSDSDSDDSSDDEK